MVFNWDEPLCELHFKNMTVKALLKIDCGGPVRMLLQKSR